MDLNQNLDEMVDSFYKYKIIVERAKKGGFDKFVDSQFPTNEDSIGEELMGYFSSGLDWNRKSDV